MTLESAIRELNQYATIVYLFTERMIDTQNVSIAEFTNMSDKLNTLQNLITTDLYQIPLINKELVNKISSQMNLIKYRLATGAVHNRCFSVIAKNWGNPTFSQYEILIQMINELNQINQIKSGCYTITNELPDVSHLHAQIKRIEEEKHTWIERDLLFYNEKTLLVEENKAKDHIISDIHRQLKYFELKNETCAHNNLLLIAEHKAKDDRISDLHKQLKTLELKVNTGNINININDIDECSVCFENIKLYDLHCGGNHKLCGLCMKKIISTTDSCPICRRTLFCN